MVLQSGAKINITDGACPERIVTVSGSSQAILKAFTLICHKFEEDLNSLVTPAGVPKPPITLRLIVPASQCGSLIGKGEDCQNTSDGSYTSPALRREQDQGDPGGDGGECAGGQ